MSNDEKHRGPEYVPAGPVRIRSTSVVANPLQSLIDRIVVLEAQVASLQSAAPRGIPKP
jgi:hypothetical protein